MHRHAILAGGLCVILLLFACMSATAKQIAFDYDSHPRAFKVCQLMITGGTPPPVPGPIEGLLGPGSPLPRRWTLVNPLADPAAPSPWAAILDPGAV
ncbi:MAG: hypothetical protein ACE5JM_13060, partial [Armatimonadota bacterium]